MAILKIYEKKPGPFSLPHFLLINGQVLGVMKNSVKVELPSGRYLVTIRSSIKFIESSVFAEVHDDTENCVEFSDRGKIWDIIFYIDLVFWIVLRFIEISSPWGIIYEILSNGFFIAWLLRTWMIRKKYFQMRSFCKILTNN